MDRPLDTPPNPRAARNLLFGRVLTLPLLVASALAVISTVAGGVVERFAATGTVGVLIVAPLARVLWLVARWRARGDYRFAAVGTALLAVIACGTAISFL